MKRGLGFHVYIALLSLFGLVGLFYIRQMDAFRTVSRDGVAMDTVLRISLNVPRGFKNPDGLLDEVFGLIDRLDAKLSMYDPASDVARVNAMAGEKPVKVCDDAFSVIRTASELSAATEGFYDPTIGPVTALWGVGGGSAFEAPPDASVAEILTRVGYEKLRLLPPDRVYLTEPGAALDLGGIAKGYASRKVCELLTSRGIYSALVDLGGNVAVLGGRRNDEPWRIGIRHPDGGRGTPLCVLSVYTVSVITAGTYERFQEADGRRYTHIFDPHTGFPVEGDLLSVTVICDDPTAGDALSTAFMAMGVERSIDLLRIMPGIGAVFVSRDGNDGVTIQATSGLRGMIETMDEKTEISFIELL